MTWTMATNPLNNIGLSALAAAVPILYLFWALAYKRMKGHIAAVSAVIIAILISVTVYGMPIKLAALSTFNGMLFGLWPVAWIVVTAVFIYNLSVKTGQFEIIKNSLASISDDRRLQAMLIAFSFGAFLEGAAGFGTPVAISAAMLVGLGFNPLYAAGLCLLANTAPVAFGAIGIPIVVGAQVSGMPLMALSQMVGRTLPFISILVPMYLVILMSGWKNGMEVWPAGLVCGGSFALTQWLTSNFLGPLLPDILASIVSIVCMVIFLKKWHPKNIWRFADEPASQGREVLKYSGGQVFRAWAPFIILSLFVAAWGIKPVKEALDYFTLINFKIPGLDKMVIGGNGPIPAVYGLNILSAAGTAILLAGLFSVPVMGASVATAVEVAANTVYTLRWAVVTISLVLGFAYIMNFSGMTVTLGNAFASTGKLFPFFSPFMGWLGVFMTGSDTSANALFGKLQHITASKIGVDPLVTVSANTCGGVCGKMISPQSLSVATAAVGLVGKEADIFRFTFKHSLVLTGVVGLMTMALAYGVTWMVPQYVIATASAAAKAAAAAPAFPSQGLFYLVIAMFVVVIVAISSRVMGGKTA